MILEPLPERPDEQPHGQAELVAIITGCGGVRLPLDSQQGLRGLGEVSRLPRPSLHNIRQTFALQSM